MDIQLVFTVATKAELPSDLPFSVLTAKALASGGLGLLSPSVGILIVVTGVGLGASARAAQIICEQLDPLYVVNVGTCGTSLPRYYREVVQFFDRRLPFSANFYRHYHPMITSSFMPITDSKTCAAPFVDMEAQTQKRIFEHHNISFHCLKYVTDTLDERQYYDNLPLVHDWLHDLFLSLMIPISGADISVVIPAFNRPEMSARALESVLAQTVLPDTIMIIDDGSSPPLHDHLHDYMNTRIVRLPKNKGVSVARNTGIAHTHTPWLCFLDNDDVWAPDHLASLITYQQTYPFYRWMQTQEHWIRDDKKVKQRPYHLSTSGWSLERCLDQCIVSPSAVMVHRSLFDTAGQFDTALRYCEDFQLWQRFATYTPLGVVEKKTVTKYAGHADQLSQQVILDRYRIKALRHHMQTMPSAQCRELLVRKLKRLLSDEPESNPSR